MGNKTKDFQGINNNDDNGKVDDKNDENKMNLLNKTKHPTRKD